MAVDIDESEPGAHQRGSRPVLRLVGRGYPFSNDNSAAEFPDQIDDEARDASDSDAHPRSGWSSRRRGPLITRWIGFAARRQRAQERTDRLAREHEAQRPRLCPTR